MSVRDQELDGLRPRETAPDFRHLGHNALAWQSMAQENNEPIVTGHHVPTVSRIAHIDGDPIPDRWRFRTRRHPRRIGRRRLTGRV